MAASAPASAASGAPSLNRLCFGWLQHYLDVTLLRVDALNFEIERNFSRKIAVLKNKSGEVTVVMRGERMHRDGMVLGSAGYEDEQGAYTADLTETADYLEGFPCGADGFCTGILTRFPKPEWSLALGPGDEYVSVHIPRDSSLAESEQSYKDAAALFARCFPNFAPRALVCTSWLMDTRLDAICGCTPNIVNFQKPYTAFPLLSDGRDIFTFVFTKPFDRLEDLPEDTRMMRALKKRYLEGSFVHEFGGIILL